MARAVPVGRRDDAARGLSHSLQRRRRRGAPAGDAMVHPLRRAAPAVEGIADRARARSGGAGQSGGRRRGRAARGGGSAEGLSVSVAASLARRTRQGRAAASRRPLAALERCETFLSELAEPPETEAERRRMTSTLHALDHASRLAEILGDGGLPAPPDRRPRRSPGRRALPAGHALDGDVGESITRRIGAQPARRADRLERLARTRRGARGGRERGEGLGGDAARTSRRDPRLGRVRRSAPRAEAFARIDAARRLDRIAHHAWRSAAHLLGLGDLRAFKGGNAQISGADDEKGREGGTEREQCGDIEVGIGTDGMARHVGGGRRDEAPRRSGPRSRRRRSRRAAEDPRAEPPAAGQEAGPLMRFLAQFNNVLVYVLLAAGFVKLMLSLWLDASIIFARRHPQFGARLFSGGRAEKALDSIRNMLSAEARAVRDGETRLHSRRGPGAGRHRAARSPATRSRPTCG